MAAGSQQPPTEQHPPTEPGNGTPPESQDRADQDRADQDRATGERAGENRGQPSLDPAELHDRLQRTQADLDNLRKRQARDRAQALAAERSAVAGAWLPVLDNLERALEHAEADPTAIVAGVRAVHDQAVELLARLGYPRQDEVGVPFDPTRHEVVTVVDEPDAGPGTVVRVLRPGYGEADRQLRPQAVAVSRRPE
jgi:molecular chaperone GrpE